MLTQTSTIFLWHDPSKERFFGRIFMFAFLDAVFLCAPEIHVIQHILRINELKT